MASLTLSVPSPLGVVNQAYSITPIVSGGTAPYTYALDTDLPSALSFDTTTGKITGTFKVATVYNGTMTVTDSVGNTTTCAVAFSSVEQVKFIPISLSDMDAGQTISQPLLTTGGGGNKVFSYTGKLPDGLDFDPTKGLLYGTVSGSGAYDLSFTVTDDSGSDTLSGRITVYTAMEASGIPSTMTVGVDADAEINITGGKTPYTVTMTGSLPAGVTAIDSNTKLTGAPTTVDTTSAVFTITDATNATLTYPVTISTVNIVKITPITDVQNVYYDIDYSLQLETTNGSGVPTFSIGSGAFPSGIGIDSRKGLISGRATPVATSTSVTVIVTDDSGSDQITLQFDVSSNLTVSGSATNNFVGTAYSFTPTVIGALNGKFTASIAPALAPGLSLDPATGKIYGTPTKSGDYSYILTINDGKYTKTLPISFSIYDVVKITSAPPASTVGQSSNWLISVTGGSGERSYYQSGVLPDGLSFNNTAPAIGGVPTKAGTFTYTLTVVDATGQYNFTIEQTISDVLEITGTPSPVKVGDVFSFVPTVTGGIVTKRIFTTDVTLPSYLSFDKATGRIYGIMGTEQSIAVTLGVSDGITQVSLPVVIQSYTAVTLVAASGTIQTPIGSVFSWEPSVLHGVGQKTFSVVSGSYPPELTFDPLTGLLKGTLTSTWNDVLKITVTDDSGSSTQSYSFAAIAPLVVSYPSVIAATGQSRNFAPQITGGADNKTFKLVSAVSDGIKIDASTGVITANVLDVRSAYNAIVQYSDAFTTATVTVTIVQVPPLVLTGTPTTVIAGTPYSYKFTLTGGYGDKNVKLIDGVLPNGLRLDSSTVTVSGSVTTPVTRTVTIYAYDDSGETTLQATFNAQAALKITSESIIAVVGYPLSYPLKISGGGGTYSIVSSSGLSSQYNLDTTSFTIEGTPTATDDSTVTVIVTDGLSRATGDIEIVTNPAVRLSSSPSTGAVGVSYRIPIVIAGGGGQNSVGLYAGTLPPGVTILRDTQGWWLSGVPTSIGSYDFTLQVIDQYSSDRESYTVTIETSGDVDSVEFTQQFLDLMTLFSTTYQGVTTMTSATAAKLMVIFERITLMVVETRNKTIQNEYLSLILNGAPLFFTENSFFLYTGNLTVVNRDLVTNVYAITYSLTHSRNTLREQSVRFLKTFPVAQYYVVYLLAYAGY